VALVSEIENMKVFVVTVLAPSDWTTTDVVSSVHIGMRQYAEKENKPLGVMDYHAMAHTSFELKRGES
jgi:hypothetical protein